MVLPDAVCNDTPVPNLPPGPAPAPWGDRYRPVRALGYGAFGTVFQAVDCQTGRHLAVKVVSRDAASARRRADIEREILAELSHPFLPTLHWYWESESGSRAILFLDYCAGGDLNALRKLQPEFRFSESAVRFYGAEVVLALEHLHEKGIAYRDLKPENILLQENGHLMLTDFDLSLRLPPPTPPPDNPNGDLPEEIVTSFLSCMSRPSQKTRQRRGRFCPCRVAPLLLQEMSNGGRRKSRSKPKLVGTTGQLNSFVGTEEYMAPEVIRGSGHNQGVDWWALGVLLYEMSYGISPFKGQSRQETFYRVLSWEPKFLGNNSSPLKNLILRLLTKDPSSRLGCSPAGVKEVKSHPFFEGVKWDVLPHVARPPFLSLPLSLEDDWPKIDFEEHLTKVEQARSKMKKGAKSHIDDHSNSKSLHIDEV